MSETSDGFESYAVRERKALAELGIVIYHDDGHVIAAWANSGETGGGPTTGAAVADLLGIDRTEAHDLIARAMEARREGVWDNTTASLMDDLRRQVDEFGRDVAQVSVDWGRQTVADAVALVRWLRRRRA